MKRIFCICLLLISCQPCVHAEVDIDRLADAIKIAEGVKSRYPYGIISVKCKGEQECRQICKNTIRNNLKRWAKTEQKVPFLTFLGSKYAPTKGKSLNKAERRLNPNWVKNVQYHYERMKGA